MGNREKWMDLINRMLKQVDAQKLRQVYFFLLGFLGNPSVPDPDMESST